MLGSGRHWLYSTLMSEATWNLKLCDAKPRLIKIIISKIHKSSMNFNLSSSSRKSALWFVWDNYSQMPNSPPWGHPPFIVWVELDSLFHLIFIFRFFKKDMIMGIRLEWIPFFYKWFPPYCLRLTVKGLWPVQKVGNHCKCFFLTVFVNCS